MIFTIGDIHGCDEKLKESLGFLSQQVQSEDTVVFLGDYIDRGKGSHEVVEMLLEWKEQHPNTVFLRGNHEQMILDAREEGLEFGEDAIYLSDDLALWWRNGGNKTVESYGGSRQTWLKKIPRSHWTFFRKTQMEYVEGNYHFVHAGLLPEGATWEYADEGIDPRLWIRDEFILSDADFGGRTVVFGHTPQLDGMPLVRSNKIGLDTGAVFGGKLTVACFNPEAAHEDRLHFQMWQY